MLAKKYAEIVCVYIRAPAATELAGQNWQLTNLYQSPKKILFF
jgi:hypothetical protein